MRAPRAVAWSEFGRRGYGATTIRDIASAAGLSTGSVYRTVGSKEELLTSIMGPSRQRGWRRGGRACWRPTPRASRSSTP